MRTGCQSLWVALVPLLLGGCEGATRTGEEAEPAQGRAAAARGLAAPEARLLLAERPGALVLDVRNPEEWNDDLGHIEGARLIPLGLLAERMAEIEEWKDRPIVVVCRSGSRSQRAAAMLAAGGYRQVFNLEGGMVAWRRTERDSGS